MKRLIIPSLLALMAVGLSSQARAGVSFGITINDHFPHVPVPHVVVTPPCPPPVVVAQPCPPPVVISRPPVVVEPRRYEYVRECDRVEVRRYDRYDRHDRYRNDHDRYRHLPPGHRR